MQQYVNLGDLIFVSGKLQTRSWEQDGVKRYSTEIVVNQMQMLGSKGDNQAQQSQPAKPTPTAYGQPQPDEGPPGAEDPELPF